VAEKVELSAPPDIEIIKDGKRVDTSAIDDYDGFMSFLMQASIAANTAKIRKHYDDRTSKGGATPFNLSLTPATQEIRCPYPSQSLYLDNNGPGQIFVSINAREEPAIPVAAFRKVYVPYETHVIECFFVRSAAGTVATATALLKY